MPAQALSISRKIFREAIGNAPRAAVNLAARLQPHALFAGLAYGAGPRRTLDVYAPQRLSRSPSPVMCFLYGGSWSSGAKEIYRFLGAALAARGFLVVIPDYSVYPAARYPAFLEDAAEALRWTRDNAAGFHGAPDQLFVMGHSAGAHIATMLAFEKRWLGGVGLDGARDLAGVIGLAGPYHFEIDTELLRGVFGPPERKSATQPLAHVSAHAPPLLLATGDADRIVSPRNTHDLASAVRAAGGDAKAIVYPRLGHREIVGAFSPLFRFLAPVAEDVSAFVSTKCAPADNTATNGGGNERGLDERV